MAERITNQDASEMAKAIMSKAEQGRREFAERTGCDCCDPTSPSPDPVVVRLEAEVEELKAQLEAAGDGDTWRDACKRVEAELECERVRRVAAESNHEALLNVNQRLEQEVGRLNFDLCQCRLELTTAREIAHRLGAERDTLQAAIDDIRGTDVHYLRGVVNVLASKLAHYTGKTVPTEITGAESVVEENARLRGLLREAVEARWSANGMMTVVRTEWFDEAQAAVEGKP